MLPARRSKFPRSLLFLAILALIGLFIVYFLLIKPATKNSPTSNLSVETKWSEIDSSGKKIKVAIVAPQPAGIYPAIVFLHGAEGLRDSHLAMAKDLAKEGFVVLVGCWFEGSHLPFEPPFDPFGAKIPCPGGPAFEGSSKNATTQVASIISYARSLANVKKDKIGLIGHSVGATTALLTASQANKVTGVVAVAAEYGKMGPNDLTPIEEAKNLGSAVLILHGTNDEFSNISLAKSYEAKLKELSKTVQSYYYENESHLLLYSFLKKSDVLKRSADYFNSILR